MTARYHAEGVETVGENETLEWRRVSAEAPTSLVVVRCSARVGTAKHIRHLPITR